LPTAARPRSCQPGQRPSICNIDRDIPSEGFSRFDSAHEQGQVPRQIVRVRHILDPPGHQLFARTVQHGAEPIIDHPEVPIGAGLTQSHLCLSEDRRQKTFACPQGFLSHLSIGDIETETADARWTSILTRQDLTTDLVPAGVFSRVCGPVLHPQITDRLFKALPQRKFHRLSVIGMNFFYPGGAGDRHGLLNASTGFVLAARP